jgi:hypothetical protein
MSNLGLLKYRIDNIKSHLYVQSATLDVTQQRLRLLEYKSIDTEARSRENNVVISGIPESNGEDPVKLVKNFIDANLKLDTSQFFSHPCI